MGKYQTKPYMGGLCDPDKATTCSKENCYINGGKCRHTTNVEWLKDSEIKAPICEHCQLNEDFGNCIGKQNNLNEKYSCQLFVAKEKGVN